MVSVFLLQSPDRYQNVDEVIHKELLSWYLCLYINLGIGLMMLRR